MCCDMFSLDISNGCGFDDDGYDNGVGVGDEDVGFGWEGVVCVCNIYVGDVTNLSKGGICGAVVESVISVSISDSFVLGGIDGTWAVR